MSAGENVELLKKYWQLFLNEETGAMLDMQTDDSIWIVGIGPRRQSRALFRHLSRP